MAQKKKAEDVIPSHSQPAKRRKDHTRQDKDKDNFRQEVLVTQGTEPRPAEAKKRGEARNNGKKGHPQSEATQGTQSRLTHANPRRRPKDTQTTAPVQHQGQAEQSTGSNAQGGWLPGSRRPGAVDTASASSNPSGATVQAPVTSTPIPQFLDSLATAAKQSSAHNGPSGDDTHTASHRSNPRPQRVLGDDEPCPVDWTHHKLRSVKPAAKEAYLMRSPWKSKADHSIEHIKATLDAKYSVNISTEAWRKRSISVNKMVFKATGMWWQEFPMGLEKLVPDLGANKKVKLTEASQWKAAASGEANGEAVPAKKKMKKLPTVRGPIFLLLCEEETEPGTLNEYVRRTTLEAAAKASPFFKEAIAARKDDYDMTLETTLVTTQRTLDIFLSCFAPEESASLPKSTYVLDHGPEETFQYKEAPLDMTLADLFNLYILAAQLESAKVCNMVLNAWRNIAVDENKVNHEFRTGARPLSCLSLSPSILDFETQDLNTLYRDESVCNGFPAAREFWLDVLEGKGESGFHRIRDNLDEFDDDFLVAYADRLPKAKVNQLFGYPDTLASTAYNPENAYGGDPDVIMAYSSDEESDKSPTDSSHKDVRSSQVAGASAESVPCSTIDRSEHLLYATQASIRTFEEKVRCMKRDHRISGEDSDPVEFAREISMLEKHIAFLRGRALSLRLREQPSPERRNGQSLTANRDWAQKQGWDVILNESDELFCTRFHLHNGEPCTLPAQATEPIRLVPSESRRVTRPDHHVKMTIDGVPGYIIQNHTGDSNALFQEYPMYYPEWDWEKVRAVHRFYQIPSEYSNLYDHHPMLEPVPIYFDGTTGNGDKSGYGSALRKTRQHPWQDKFGRWPSHPGYRNPLWTPPSAIEDDMSYGPGTPQLSETWQNSEEGEDDDSPQLLNLGGKQLEQVDNTTTNPEDEEPEHDHSATPKPQGEQAARDTQEVRQGVPSTFALQPLDSRTPNVPHLSSWWGLRFEDQGWLR